MKDLFKIEINNAYKTYSQSIILSKTNEHLKVYCIHCNCYINYSNAFGHTITRKHLLNLGECENIIYSTRDTKNKERFFCEICHKSMLKKSISNHNQTKSHLKRFISKMKSKTKKNNI